MMQGKKHGDTKTSPAYRIASFFTQRPLFTLIFPAFLGIYIGQNTPFSPLLFQGGMVLAFLLVVICIIYNKKWVYPSCFLFFVVFMAITSLYASKTLPPQGEYFVNAHLTSSPILAENGQVKMYVDDVRLTDEAGNGFFEKHAYWTFYLKKNQPIPKLGDTVSAKVRLYHPQGKMNPSGYDFRIALLGKKIYVGLYGSEDLAFTDTPGFSLKTTMSAVHQDIVERLDFLFHEQSHLPKALILGDKQDMPEEMYQAFSKTGIAHVLAVSGLHVSLIVGFLAILLKRFFPPLLRAITITIFLVWYCFLLGFSHGATRASIMSAVYLFSRARGRNADPLSVISFSCLLILFVNPFALFSYGFVLSFSSVFAIILMNDTMMKLSSIIPHRGIQSAFATTLSACIGTYIPISCFFNRFSLMGFVVSPLVCALIAFILPGYAVVLLLSYVFIPFAEILAFPFQWFSKYLTLICTQIATWRLTSFSVPQTPWYIIPLFIISCWIISSFSIMKSKTKVCLLLIATVFAISAHFVSEPNLVEYYQFSVGQADCAVIIDGEKTILVDAGENGYQLSKFLLSKGRNVDILVITHLQADHYMGVKDLVKEGIKIDTIYLPIHALEQEISYDAKNTVKMLEEITNIEYLKAGDAFSTERINATVMWPNETTVRTQTDPNDYCLSLLLDIQGIKCYMGADITATFDKYAATDVDILKVAHHGSKYDTSKEFLDIATPQVAIISSDYTQTTPSRRVLQDLDAIGATTYITGEFGAIKVIFHEDDYTVQPYVYKGVGK